MLLQMRSFTRSWIAYALLFLLVVAFAIWGVNDVFGGGGNQTIARVGGETITPVQLQRELDLALRFQRSQGNNMTRQEAIDEGGHLALLDDMIERLATSVYARRINVSASNAQVAETIRNIPSITNPVTGTFDEALYQRFVVQQGYSPPEFERDVRDRLTRQMLMQSLLIGTRAPSSYGALLYAYQSETRTVSTAEAPASVVGAVPPPTDAQIQAYYEDIREQLRLPEFRVLTLVYADPQDFISRVTIPEARVREDFEARRAGLSQPERRTYVRISAQTEAQANQAAQRLSRGEDPQVVASELSLQMTRGENHARNEVPDAAVAEAVFATAPGSGPRVVQGRLSPWVVVRVDGMTAAVSPRFEDVRDEIRNAMAEEEAADLLNEAVRTFEEARAAGTGVAQAARAAGLRVVTTPAVEQGGRNQQGEVVESLAHHESAISMGFETPEGEASDFIPVGEADVIVSVDRVIPASYMPLEDVRGNLVEQWTRRERERRLRELGETVVAAVRDGQSFDAAARANGLRVTRNSQTLARATAGEQLSSDAWASQVFSAPEGQVIFAVRNDAGAIQVAIVEGITRADPTENPQELEVARLQMEESLRQSYFEAAQGAIVDSTRPRRYDDVLARLFQASNAEDGAEGQ